MPHPTYDTEQLISEAPKNLPLHSREDYILALNFIGSYNSHKPKLPSEIIYSIANMVSSGRRYDQIVTSISSPSQFSENSINAALTWLTEAKDYLNLIKRGGELSPLPQKTRLIAERIIYFPNILDNLKAEAVVNDLTFIPHYHSLLRTLAGGGSIYNFMDGVASKKYPRNVLTRRVPGYNAKLHKLFTYGKVTKYHGYNLAQSALFYNYLDRGNINWRGQNANRDVCSKLLELINAKASDLSISQHGLDGSYLGNLRQLPDYLVALDAAINKEAIDMDFKSYMQMHLNMGTIPQVFTKTMEMYSNFENYKTYIEKSANDLEISFEVMEGILYAIPKFLENVLVLNPDHDLKTNFTVDCRKICQSISEHLRISARNKYFIDHMNNRLKSV